MGPRGGGPGRVKSGGEESRGALPADLELYENVAVQAERVQL
jgi:hypothetical protein